ncbi:MAG TPA: hypothetical protein VFG89_01785 [Coriobacteriia bacterium]|nr:hypothetical protein [Coriobacteriia bacterium]
MAQRDRVYIDGERRGEFETLARRMGGVDNKDAFLFAMSYGFAHGMRKPFRDRYGFVLSKYFNEEDHCLMAAVAMAGRDEISEDFSMDEAYGIAEEYARGGIGLLREQLADGVEFRENLSIEVLQTAAGLAISERSGDATE